MSEQPLIINERISSTLTQLDSLRHSVALMTSAAEIGALGKPSEARIRRRKSWTRCVKNGFKMIRKGISNIF
jgi:hypothetical protein